MLNILIVSYSYVAAVIGAGFASGQEILCYFNNYGINGFYGLILSSFIFTVFIFITLSFCIKYSISDFNEFLCCLCNRKERRVIKYTIGIFSFAIYSVMLSAAGLLLSSFTNLSSNISTAIIALVGSVVLCSNSKNIFNFNGAIGLLLTAGIISCCFYILRYREFHVFSENISAFSNSAIYTGYNLVTSVPVIVSLSKQLKKKSDAASVSLISGTALLIMTLLIFVILSIYYGKINLGDFPMLTLANRQNHIFAKIYLIIFCGAVVTTLLASGISVIETFNMNNIKCSIFIMSAIAYAAAGFGFGNLVNTAYRMCGVAGFFVIIYLIIKILKKIIFINKRRIKEKNTE